MLGVVLIRVRLPGGLGGPMPMTDPPLKMRVKIWPSTCVLTYQSAFWAY